MKIKRKKLPIWLLVMIDVIVITAYTAGFYGIYYLTPRELESTGIKIIQDNSVSSTQDSSTLVEEKSSDSTEDTASSIATELSNSEQNGTSTEDSQGMTNGTSQDTTTSTTSVTQDGINGTTQSTGTTQAAASTSETLAAKFAEHFTDTVVSTENSYSSENISISIQQYSQGSGSSKITYYVADIYIADITSLQTGFAENSYGVGYTDDLLEMDESINAILAMNGDYYGNGSNGVVIRNGEVYRSDVNGSDVCVLYYDGTMKTYSGTEFDIDDAIAEGAWQAWCFGPELLDDSGNSMSDFNSSSHVSRENPRSALGYYEPGHYCMVVVDGRQSGYSAGMDLEQLSNLMEELGCTTAYNMDGGKSSVMTYNDDYVNQPADGGREISDCIVIKEIN